MGRGTRTGGDKHKSLHYDNLFLVVLKLLKASTFTNKHSLVLTEQFTISH